MHEDFLVFNSVFLHAQPHLIGKDFSDVQQQNQQSPKHWGFLHESFTPTPLMLPEVAPQ